MVAVTKNPEGGDQLDHLALLAGALESEHPDQAKMDQAQQRQEAEDAKVISALEASFTNMLFGLLKAGRRKVANTLPEILEHWPDATLQPVATFAIPVGKKYLAKLLPMLADYPEEAALAVAALPMLIGYGAALSSHEATITDAKSKPAANDS